MTHKKLSTRKTTSTGRTGRKKAPAKSEPKNVPVISVKHDRDGSVEVGITSEVNDRVFRLLDKAEQAFDSGEVKLGNGYANSANFTTRHGTLCLQAAAMSRRVQAGV